MATEVLGDPPSYYWSRLGLPLAAPAGTATRLLADRKATFYTVVPWLLLLALAMVPERVGQGVLLLRVDLVSGVLVVAESLFARVAGPVVLSVVLAVGLHAVVRNEHGPVLSLDRALDLSSFALVPYMVLGAVGISMAEMGWDVRVLPHHRLGAPGGSSWMRCLIAYGPSLVLVLVWAKVLRAKA